MERHRRWPPLRRIHPGSIAPRRLIESGKPERPLSSFPSNQTRFFLAQPPLVLPRHRSRRTHAPCLYKDFIENAPVARLQSGQPSTAGLLSYPSWFVSLVNWSSRVETRIRWTTMFGTSGVLIGRSARIFDGSKVAYGFSST